MINSLQLPTGEEEGPPIIVNSDLFIEEL